MNPMSNERPMSTADLVQAAKAPEMRDAELREDLRDEHRAREQAMRSDDGTMSMSQHLDDGHPRPDGDGRHAATEALAALFTPDVAQGFRTRWDEVQIGFVDDPRNAVQKADELVAQVMTSLAETFSKERSNLEHFMNDGDGEGRGATENMRVALQRYRSFFQRLLAL
jgi:hypothetical protein